PLHPSPGAQKWAYAQIGRGNPSHAPFARTYPLCPSRSSSEHFACRAPPVGGPSLFSVGQADTALRTTASQNLATIAGSHTLTETVLFGALTLFGLIGTKHGGHLLI